MNDLRSLPRAFVPGATDVGPFELPADELDQFRKVLRLSSGAEIGILPNDGTLIRCRLDGRSAVPLTRVKLSTESHVRLTIVQSLPKGDKLDEIVRACTEIGVASFELFASDRTVVKWDTKKTTERLRRLEVIAREACEMSFRARLPSFEVEKGLEAVLEKHPNAVVLSEIEELSRTLPSSLREICLVVGPEGGWSARELRLIGDRGVTLGPRVLRVDHAAAAAAAMLLLAH